MNTSKEQRIRKLKRGRILPTALGLTLFLALTVSILSLLFASSVMDTIQKKLADSCRTSVRVAELFADYGEESKADIQQKVFSHIDVLDVIDAVAVTDSEGNRVWSSNGIYPDISETASVEFISGIADNKIVVVPSDGEESLFVIKDGKLAFNKDATSHIDSESALRSETPFAKLELWMVIPVNGLNVAVLNNVPVYFQDFIMLVISLLLYLLLLVIFIIYHFASVIRMLLSVRRTRKILYTDVVTGGDNWLSFIRKGTNLLKKSGILNRKYAMVHLEMRKYRSFCTCFGVNRGQELIEKYYAALKNEITQKEAAAHQENAEFGLLLTYEDTAQLEERILKLEDALSAVSPEIKAYFGVGVYPVNSGENDIEQLHNNALTACETIGDEAENMTVFYNAEMNRQKIWERKVENDMDRALANREFQVYLQPKISTTGEALGGAEALVRWIHPTEGFIPPNRFIPIFETNGFILKLDDYMLEEIAKVQAGWLAEGRTLVPISVNVSRAHFTREDLAEHICAIVDRYQVPHNVIELELTESAFFDDKRVLINTVQKLRAAGFQVSMDDFGAGYSSLNSLKELQIDVLKIDANFFRGADSAERGMLIVSEVIDLAKKLNMKIVAEGIESREQVDFLTEQECDLIQGYFYAKPMPVAEFAEKYRA